MAGAGHAAAGMVRRATAPTPPQYFDASLTPPPTSASPAASREGTRPSFYEGPPPIERRDSFEGSNPRRSSTAFNGRRSMDSMYAPQSRGCDSMQTLEDENRILREELSRLQSSAIDSLHRRPMAAIAGGGFRGPSSTQTKSVCMCDSLRSKLAKIRQELRDTQQQRLPSRGGFPNEVRDNEAQTSPMLSLRSPVEMEVQNLYQPPQTAPSSFWGASRTLASAVRCSSLIDALTQTDSKVTAEASSQAVSSICHTEAQTAAPRSEELGVQAGAGISQPAHAETQTAQPPMLLDSAAQADPTDASEVAIQAGGPPAISTDAGAQTETTPAPAAGVAAEVQCTAESSAVAAQTDPPAVADAACEVDFTRAPKVKNSCSAASQTIPPARTVAAVQTVKPKGVCAATQAAPPAGVDRATQAEDGSLLEQRAESEKRIAESEARVQELEARLARLSEENEALAADSKKAQDSVKALQQMAQTKAFGQMNVTILCPRAECTVSGERVEMDSWNPQRLREEFEREVLPRFTRVFVEETHGGGPKGGKARSEAVDKAMQDFAETFRERLSAMLSAPNAAAAVQAAAAAKGARQ